MKCLIDKVFFVFTNLVHKGSFFGSILDIDGAQIFDLRIKKQHSTIFDILGFIHAQSKWFGNKIDDTVGCLRQITTSKRKFVEISQDKKTISDSDTYRKNISSYVEISSRTKSDFVVRFVLQI